MARRAQDLDAIALCGELPAATRAVRRRPLHRRALPLRRRQRGDAARHIRRDGRPEQRPDQARRRRQWPRLDAGKPVQRRRARQQRHDRLHAVRVRAFLAGRPRPCRRRIGAAVRRPAGRADPDHQERRAARDAVPQPDLEGGVLRRAGAARPRVPSEVRAERVLLRLLHADRRRRADDRALPAHAGQHEPRRSGVGEAAAPDPAFRPVQPQRREDGVRSRRLPLHRHRRWRRQQRQRGRRQQRAESVGPAREDAPARRRSEHGNAAVLRHSADQSVRAQRLRRREHRRLSRDLGARAAQPLALDVRPTHRRPVHRRRGARRARGSGLRPLARDAGSQLRLADHGGQPLHAGRRVRRRARRRPTTRRRSSTTRIRPASP